MDGIPVQTMQTLFSENIYSKSKPIPPPPTDFEVSWERYFGTSSNTTSSGGSPSKNDWLTQHYLQSQPQSTTEPDTTFSHGQPTTPVKRKGNQKLLFMGMRRCGKSSVQKVVFQKMSPADTLYLEPTNKIESATMQSFLQFSSAEIPTHLSIPSPTESDPFINVGAVIWIIDAQDDYYPSIAELLRLAVYLTENAPRVNLEVFIHKTDGLSDEYKHDTFREVRQRVQDELSDYGYGGRLVSYHQTSIFDPSIYDAMSKVVQKLIPQLPAMERLLTKLCSTCRIRKAYIFDTISKVYIATDASPTFLRDYEVCAEFVDVIVDIKQLYAWHGKEEAANGSDSERTPDSPSKNRTAKRPSDAAMMGESLVTYAPSGDAYMYAREINDSLSLICIMGNGSSVERRALVDYNVEILRDAMLKIFNV